MMMIMMTTNQTQKMENFIVPYPGKTLHIFKPENLLPFTQDHTTCPPHEQDKFLPHLSLFWLYLHQCLPFTPRSPERSLAFIFPTEILDMFLSHHSCYMSYPSIPPVFAYASNLVYVTNYEGTQCTVFSILLLLPLLYVPIFQLRALFSVTLSMFLLHVVVCSAILFP